MSRSWISAQAPEFLWIHHFLHPSLQRRQPAEDHSRQLINKGPDLRGLLDSKGERVRTLDSGDEQFEANQI